MPRLDQAAGLHDEAHLLGQGAPLGVRAVQRFDALVHLRDLFVAHLGKLP